MNRRTIVAAVAPAVIILAGCGGGVPSASGTTSSRASADPHTAVLQSLQKTTSQSFLADMTLTESMSATGPNAAKLGALAGQTITMTAKMEAESHQRLRMTLDSVVAGRAIHVIAVAYDGVVYVSSDGGTTYRTVNTGISNPYASENALSYLEAVGTVTDNGAGTADGVSVERYTAQLDGAKALALIKGALTGTQNQQIQQIFNSVTFDSGSMEVAIDQQGRLVSESGPLAMSVDLGGYQSSLAGTILHVRETVDAHFHDYGTPVTITKPSAAAGVASS